MTDKWKSCMNEEKWNDNTTIINKWNILCVCVHVHLSNVNLIPFKATSHFNIMLLNYLQWITTTGGCKNFYKVEREQLHLGSQYDAF